MQNLKNLPLSFLDLFFAQLFVLEHHDLFDGAGALAQTIGNFQKVFDDYGRTGYGFEDEKAATLNALGERDFSLARQ